MVNINLLPWRKYEREYQIKALKKALVITMVLVLVIHIGLHVVVTQQKESVQERISSINEKLVSYRTNHLKPDRRHQERINQNTFSLKLFSELGKKNHEMICFTQVERLDNTFSFTGKARSMSDLTEFLRYWNAVYLFTEIKIKLIEEQENGGVRFGLQAII